MTVKDHFPWKRTFLLGFGFLGISIFWPIFNQFIPIFLQGGNPEFNRQLIEQGRDFTGMTGFGLSPALAMFVMTWDNIINIFLQPWVGAKSDQTRNRFGRRKGWILLGAPIAILGFFFIPLAQSLVAIMVFIMITNIGMALFRSPTVAWLGDLFTPDQRSHANGVINLMGGIGGLMAYFGGGMLFNAFGRFAPFAAGGIATGIAMLVVLIFIREPEQMPVEKNEKVDVLGNFRQLFENPDRSGLFVLLGILLWFIAFSALETGLSSFAVFTLGMEPGTASMLTGSMTVSFILFAVPAGLIGSRWGRKNTIRTGLAGLTLLFLAGYFFIHTPISLVTVLVLCGFFWALVNVNSLPLVYDHGNKLKMGASTGFYYSSSQLASVLGPSLGGFLVGILGNQYRWLWLFSTVFMVLAWLVMAGAGRRDVKTISASGRAT
jgi:maltose/moltooligosaccharide transporter